MTGIKDFDVFITLDGIKRTTDGLVHVLHLASKRINHLSDFVQLGQSVKVKITSIDGTKIGLSMKDVDQESGQDLAPMTRLGTGDNMHALGEGHNQDTANLPVMMLMIGEARD